MTKAQLKKEESIPKAADQANLPVAKKAIKAVPTVNQTSPFTLMRHIAEDMENMMADFGMERRFRSPFLTNDFFSPAFSIFEKEPFFTESANAMNLWSPQVELTHRDNQLVVRADLPGVKKDDIKVEINENGLTIQGERKHEEEEKHEGYFRSERSYGSFYRAVPLPKGTKTDNTKATFKDGVLEISVEVPKLANGGKRLEITEG